MAKKQNTKIIVDIIMAVMLLLLMSHSLIGEKIHEVVGVGMLVILFLHHMLNGKWISAVIKGSYTAFRIFQTILVVLLALTLFGSMMSGIVLSKYVFRFLQIEGGRSLARTIHMFCAYWGFVLMSLHIGLHWAVIYNRIRLAVPMLGKRSFRITAWMMGVYGIFAFIKKNIGGYLLMKNTFAFFDFSESILLFLFDYLSIMILFAAIGHYGAFVVRR